MEILTECFGDLNGETVHSFTLRNEYGMEVTCINYGCTITRIVVPDRNGILENVVIGFSCLEDYLMYSQYFGAICGRVAGRIKNAEFILDGTVYKLAKNDRKNHLHGGNIGYDKVLWDTKIIHSEHCVSIEFSRTSPDGEEGYPGNLEMKVTYTLTNENELIISYHGIADQKTLVNITNHTYYNLRGELKRDILEHELVIKSDKFLELNSELLPTGDHLNVENTPFDFRKGRKISDGVKSQNIQNVLVNEGYDHPFLLNVNHQQEIMLKEPISGRALIIETDEPYVVLYTGNSRLDHFEINGVQSRKYLGLCLETQGAPDAIHHSHLPSIILEKGKVYSKKTKYKFSTF